MNPYSGIGMAYQTHETPSFTQQNRYDEDEMQPNTANPFKKTIIDIIQTRNVPSQSSLESLLGCLGSQEDKLHAIECGMIPSIFKIYDNCHSSDETIPIRILLLHMLRSFSILMRGRSIIFSSIGIDRVLHFLTDPSDEVRRATCDMLTCLCSFPEVKAEVKKERKILNAIVFTFLHDSHESVTDAAIPTLQQLTVDDPLLDEATLTKLARVIVRTTAASKEDRKELALLKVALQVVWNCSLNSREKSLAISVGIVDVVVPLLANEFGGDIETLREATGVLASLATDQRGKLAIIAQPGAVAQICKLTLDKRGSQRSALASAVRANACALLKNFAEAPTGLATVGAFMIPEPDTLREVLGPVQVAKVLDSRLAAIANNDPSLTINDALYTMRCMLALLKSGPDGHQAAWNILDVIPRLYKAAIYTPSSPSSSSSSSSSSSAAVNSSLHGESLSTLHQLGERCILLLCQENDDARLELFALGQRIGAEAQRSMEVFAAVEGSYLKLQQARQALEAQQRQEEEEAAAAVAAEKARVAAEEAAAAALAEQQALEEASRREAEQLKEANSESALTEVGTATPA